MAVDALRDRGLGRQTWLLDDFGARLRRLRMAKGWSLAVLAQCAHVSKQHLSSLERGARSPSTAVAEACDAALGAGGTLAELAAGGAARQVSGLAGWAPDAVGGPADLGTAEGELLLDTYSALFASLRAMGQLGSPELTLPSLHAGAATLSAAAARCSGRLSCDLWLLAARYAEYCGWMAQESGEEPAALAWIEA
ncbi:MAG: helix-turn-helix transcriptional regulator, partial [Catenulispora sp.]|nr:helix-turn-helix transcriptional regulator [Catenulispora sp.]